MTRTTRIASAAVAAVIALLILVSVLESHDLFLVPREFVLRPGSSVDVRVLNGTFASSEGAVTRDRLRDLSIVGPLGIQHPSDSTWSAAEKESAWRVSVGGRGTYVLGASLAPKTIHLTGAQFDDYLREEGLHDVASARKAAGISDRAAHERYAKHVKALVRVSEDGASDSSGADTAYRAVLGYPAELVPLEDPYRLGVGATLRVRALVDGKPVDGQAVLAGGRTTAGQIIPERGLRTDGDGIVRVRLHTRGAWYVKFVRMRAVPPAARDSVDYESKWATLTFARP